MRKQVQHVSQVFFNHEAAFLIGFPTAETVQLLVDSKEDFYAEKVRPTLNCFRLFPKGSVKTNPRLSASIHENIGVISQQFEYEDDHDHFSTNPKKKSHTNRSNVKMSLTKASEGEGAVIHRSPLFKLYSPANLVLKEEYSILSPDCFKRIGSKEQEEAMKERIRQWIEIGYHIHVVQAFKVDHSHGKYLVFLQKLKGKTLRDWIQNGFFQDKNKQMNSKRVLNVLLQIAVGLNYLHKRNVIHHQLIPDHIYVENQKLLKIGNIYGFNAVTSKLARNSFSGASPEYWSPEQGQIYDSAHDRTKQGNYQASMKLLPVISNKSDIYQLGLIILELIFSERLWIRGDKAYFKQIIENQQESNCTKETTEFLFDMADELLRSKPEERQPLYNFITTTLAFYSKNFKNADDLLWVKFFDEEKYQSDLLNNKAVGLYLSGNESQCQKSWSRSLASNPLNLTAQYNYSHFKRMKKIIDDTKLNKNLLLLPETRKRNFYMLISNLVMLPLLKEPFKTYNFNPKLSRHKQIEILSHVIEALDKVKKPKDYVFQCRYHLTHYKFDEAHVANDHFIGRIKNTNTFHCYLLTQQIKSHTFKSIVCSKQPQAPDSRQAYSCIDATGKLLAISENSFLAIYNLENMEEISIFHEINDYGSSITTMQFDQKSQVLGVGSNEFTIKLINLITKQVYKMINIGQKFIIKNLQYYDRNTCISYSYEKAISFHRIETTKNLFTIRCNAFIVGYKILQITLTSHLMIVQTSDKFEVWNLKDKNHIRNIEMDDINKVQSFFANSQRKIVAHFSKNAMRIWAYNSGLILKTFRTPIPLVWMHLTSDAKYLRSLDIEGNFTIRFIDFQDFLKNFDGICVPNQICLTDERDDSVEDIGLYVKLGRQLVEGLNQYTLNEQDKKVSLEKMYRLGQTIKNSVFFQDKEDIKTIFRHLNGIRQAEDRSSRINAHSEEYVFTSRGEEFITATSNFNEGHWLIGQTDGSIRMVGPPDKVVFTIKPKPMPVTYLYLQPTSIFISYNNTCIFAEKQSLNIVVSHSSYHKKPIRMGLVISSILVTGDEDELILFWNKEKVRKYSISVNMGEVVGKQLVIVGFDNRIRLYDVHHENGVQKSHVFVGHTMGIYNISSLDDGIFTTSSYDGTTRWWNAQAKNCFSYFNVKKYFPNDKILCVDLPKFSADEEKHAKFDRQGSALILLNNSQIVVFDTMRKEVKWKLELGEDVVKVFWTNYPNTFAAVTYEEVRVISIYWRYMVLKK